MILIAVGIKVVLPLDVALSAVAPSNGLLILFGPMYLQYQVNKMISMELLSPKI